ncbi:AmmeMemoRadiSam system protein B [Candidatus Fermentibacteria bacterium]|nr:MAG: AmmeMemoRadiSam system protein B [Candidatus Fermentibacteria bacterium]
MREPICAGTYYTRPESVLREEIKAAFHHDRGPGALPTEKRDGRIKAVIVPNSPYAHSAPCAAWAYKAIAETPLPNLYILLSANHHSIKSGVTAETFQTLMGEVRVDQAFARVLVEKGTISYDTEIHTRDHGIEVQLPFLQFVKSKELEKIKILPMLISSDIDMKRLALDLKETLVEQNKKAVFIVSSDFLKHGPMFHYVRFLDDVQKNIYEFDSKVIDMIKAQDGDGFFSFVDKNFAPIDGTLPITTLLYTLKKCDVKLEQYYTTADILDEKKNSVSFAAIIFQEKA